MIEYVDGIGVADFIALHVAVGWAALKPEKARRALENSAIVLSAVEGERVVGVVRVISDLCYLAHIEDVMVLPEYQGRGIGSTLVDAVLQRLRGLIDEGGQMLVCLISAPNKEGFYGRRGFVSHPNEVLGYGMTRLLKHGEG